MTNFEIEYQILLPKTYFKINFIIKLTFIIHLKIDF